MYVDASCKALLGPRPNKLEKTVDGSTSEAVLLCPLRDVRENMYMRDCDPYLNRNGSPGREPMVDGITYIREFGKLDL